MGILDFARNASRTLWERDQRLHSRLLTISVTEGDPNPQIAGIAQLSEISGCEFHRQERPVVNLPLKGKDGKTYNFPVDFNALKTPSDYYKVFCPRMERGDTLRLIIATFYNGEPKRAPDRFRITGSYDTEPSEGSIREKVDQVLPIPKS